MIYKDLVFDEERALYGVKDSTILNCKFEGPADGESAIKECKNLKIENSFFDLRYPFWHLSSGEISDSVLTENCRAALWYDEDIKIKNTKMLGIKALRECHNINVSNCTIQSDEFGWKCKNFKVSNSSVVSKYQFFECDDLSINNITMSGKYSFQYIKNAIIKNSFLDTKDAFWHSENVLVFDSIVKGEYLGWYANNLKFVRCKIIGTQPLCYVNNLVLEDCTMEETDLSFENSYVNAVVNGDILSIKNPIAGKIEADSIGEIILNDDIIEKSTCSIVTNNRLVTL